MFNILQFPSSMRLSGHQVGLVLSSIWIQATSMDNAPTNFEAMAHTYTLALSVIFTKVRYTFFYSTMLIHYRFKLRGTKY